MSTPLIIGIGIAAVAFGTRAAIKVVDKNKSTLKSSFNKFGSAVSGLTVGSGYYRGGFEAQMSRSEATKILGFTRELGITKDQVKEAHRRIMLLNHPDRGGSPFLASKINEAKVLLDKEVGRGSRRR